MADRESVSRATNIAINKAVKKAAKKRPATQLRPLYPKWKVAQNPHLSRSPYSGVSKSEGKWRRHLKHVDKSAVVEDMKNEYIQGKMDSRFKEAMRLKKRRQLFREATDSLKGRDEHVIALQNRRKREVRKKEREEYASGYRKRMEELKDEEALTCRHELLELRRQRRVSEGLSPDLDPANHNIRCNNSKLSVRRRAIERILLEHNPGMASPRKFNSLLKKWKGKELDLLRNIRNKYGVATPPKKKSSTPTKKSAASTHIPVHPPFGSAEGRQKSAFILEQRRKKRDAKLARRKLFVETVEEVPAPSKRRSRKAATPTRAQLASQVSIKKKNSGDSGSNSANAVQRRPSTPMRKTSLKPAAAAARTPISVTTAAPASAKSLPKKKVEKPPANDAPLKLETDFSEFAVIKKKPVRNELSSTDTSNDLAASIRARILKRKSTIEQLNTSPDIPDVPETPMEDEDELIETPAEDEESDDPEIEERPKPLTRHQIIAARRASLERQEIEKAIGTAELSPLNESNGPTEAPETKTEVSDESSDHDKDEEEPNTPEPQHDEITPIKSTDTEGANKLAAAMAAVQAALADDSSDDDANDGYIEDDSAEADSGGAQKNGSGPRPCTAAQNAEVVGTWTFKKVDEAFKTMQVLKDYTFTYRENRMPDEKEASSQTWMRRKGHWGSSVTGEVIQLVFSFTEVVNGSIVNGKHEAGPAEAMEEDWVITLNALQNGWDKKETASSDVIAERLEKMRLDLERANEAASDDNEEDDGEAKPPMVPPASHEVSVEEAEEEEEEYEDEEEEEEETETRSGEEEEYEEEEEEESESGEYEDEGADGKRQSMSSSFIYRSPIYIDMTLEDQLVGTWQRQEGLKDREIESIQIFADGTCSHRRDRDFKNDSGGDSREWFTSKGTWALDEEGDSLDVVFTKCNKGLQHTEGDTAESEDMVEHRAWSIQVKADLLVNWEKEEEF